MYDFTKPTAVTLRDNTIKLKCLSELHEQPTSIVVGIYPRDWLYFSELSEYGHEKSEEHKNWIRDWCSRNYSGFGVGFSVLHDPNETYQFGPG